MELRKIRPGMYLAIVVWGLLLFACRPDSGKPVVVVYTSVDQVYSEPILSQFENETGIQVLPLYDIEAAKTTGLVNRLIAEKPNPQADVFWSGEFAQTIQLKAQEALAPYRPSQGTDIPTQYRDPQDFWIGFGGRARVILVNTDLVPEGDTPDSILDFLNPQWAAAQIGIANPLFGTSATHAAALYATWGPREGRAFFDGLHDRSVQVVDGNSVVRDLVADGRLAFGLTDTDDACGAVSRRAPVRIIFPDQEPGALGTLIIPNTVGLVAGAPHLEQAKKFIDFLLRQEVEEAMILSGWSHISLRPVEVQPSCLASAIVQGMQVTLNEVYAQLERTQSDLAQIFLQ